MKLIKDGSIIELNNSSHIDAYISSGYKVYTEQEKKPAPVDKPEKKPARTRKK